MRCRPAIIAFGIFAIARVAMANDTGWSTSGGFKLKTVGLVPTVWEKPKTRWLSVKEFELSVPGFDQTKHRPRLSIAGDNRRARLLSLIASVEAPVNGYNAVHWKAAIKPPALPSKMTVGEIFDWIEQTPGQQHAIGRYQFIPSTLDLLATQMGVNHQSVFSNGLQDRLAIRLMSQAGLLKYEAGKISTEQFQDALAKVWAGLPLKNGNSAYHGLAGNRAIITREEYDAAFAKIFP